jgi:hypothetical protein
VPSVHPIEDAMSDDQPRTIAEFCKRNRISHTTYFNLRHKKKGPREMRVLGKVLISPEAEADWRRECETISDDEQVERFKERSDKAVRGRAEKRVTS